VGGEGQGFCGEPLGDRCGSFGGGDAMVVLVWSKPAEAAFPGTNGRIVFESDRDGNLDGGYELYTMNGDGSDQRRLTFTPRVDEAYAAFSPDGTKIAFVRFSRRYRTSGTWIMNADGTGLRKLDSADINANPAFSPSGTRIAFSKGGDIYTIKTNGTGLRRVTSTRRVSEGEPAWSPGGTKIAFRKGELGICTIRPDGTGFRRLTTFENYDPNWSPDGTKIIFHYYDSGANLTRLYTVNTADGSLSLIHSGALSGQAFSPDGTKITYSGNDGGPVAWQVYSLNADGSGTPTPLTSVGRNRQPDWGPA
jgi:TolB protein